MKSKQNTVVIVLILLVVVAAAVGGYLYYKNNNDKGNSSGPIDVTYNPDGTIRETPVSRTERFAYITNRDTNGVSSATGDDPMEFQYYTDKTTRGSIWKGLREFRQGELQSVGDCNAPGCKRISVTDKQGMQTMLDDIYADIKQDIEDFRAFLVTKGLHTKEAFVAKYKEYNPTGYFEYNYPTRAKTDEEISGDDRFVFEELIKGFAAYKNVPVPATMTASSFRGSSSDGFYEQLPILKQTEMIKDVMYGTVKLSSGSDRKIQMTNGQATVELTLGVNFMMSLGVLFIPIILILQEGKKINSVVYNPPANVKSIRELSAAFNSTEAKLAPLNRTEN